MKAKPKPKPKKIRSVCRQCQAIRDIVAGKRICLRCYLKTRKGE